MTAVDIGVAQRALPGERQSGDRCVVRTCAERTLIGVIDGLGHGSEAALVAAAAAAVLETFAGESVGPLLERCHEHLRDTRGAAITLVVLDTTAGMVEWVGAGSVAGALLQAQPSGHSTRRDLLVRAGIAGSSLPSTDALTLPIRPGDTVVLATDGVRRDFIAAIGSDQPPQRLAERVLARYGTAQDDALVVVARLKGPTT